MSLEIVEFLIEEREVQIDDVADRFGIASSTAHRHLQTLEEYGYVINEGGIYKLGLQFLTVGGEIRSEVPAFELAKETVDDLAAMTDERAQFEIEEEGQRVFLYTKAGEHAVRGDAKIGKRGPLHCSATGKTLLGGLPD
jgi:DNA-binding IclR family transcriptional regulator